MRKCLDFAAEINDGRIGARKASRDHYQKIYGAASPIQVIIA
jgi:hypothetical protein